MKVLDPQAALLPLSEVHQFLKANPPRKPDHPIGAYPAVNVHNYMVVRRDLETYIQGTTPYVLDQPSPDGWMRDLVMKLKPFGLTKTEVFELVNLGIGVGEASSAANGDAGGEDLNGDSNGVDDHDEDDKPHVKREGPGDEANGEAEDEEAGDAEEEGAESSLDRMLFGLVVEEADERFSGDEGEQRITEVLGIIKETINGTKENEVRQGANGT